MNTANLQMEGLLLALAGLFDVLRQKGLLTDEEIGVALARAGSGVSARRSDLSDSHQESIRFPILFLRLALERAEDLDYTSITSRIGRVRDTPETGQDSPRDTPGPRSSRKE